MMVPILGSFSEAKGLAKHSLELEIWNVQQPEGLLLLMENQAQHIR